VNFTVPHCEVHTVQALITRVTGYGTTEKYDDPKYDVFSGPSF
jgi:hypothetical protein